MFCKLMFYNLKANKILSKGYVLEIWWEKVEILLFWHLQDIEEVNH